MTPSFIVDCSLAVTWVFKDEATTETRDLFRRLSKEAALVPAHWYLEITNALVSSERRKRITPAESAQFLDTLDELEVEIDYEAGNPVAVAGKKMSPAALLAYLNKLGGAHGIGRVDLVENR